MTLTFNLLILKSIGHILDLWGVYGLSFMTIGVKQLGDINHFQQSMQCDLYLWPLDLEVDRAHPWFKGSVPVKFHDRCKGELVMHMKPFYLTNALWPWPSDPKIHSTHPTLTGSLCVKFHDDRCKGKTIMRHLSFTAINAMWPWPFDPEVNRAHPWLMESVQVMFHEDRCKGKAVMHMKPFNLTMRLDFLRGV